MKIFIITGIVLAMAATGLKADNEKNVKTKPEKVTVYLSGAQVFRNTPVNLVQGNNMIVFEGLENNIDAGSMQAGGSGDFVITEVQHLVKYPELEKLKNTSDVKYQKLVKQYNDSLLNLVYDLEDLKNKTDVLNTERSVLLSYKLYKGESKKDSLGLLKDGLAFLREKLNNINSELLKLKKENQKLELARTRINARLQEISYEIGNSSAVDVSKPNYCIVVSILSDVAATGNISINYYVDNAGWTPSYDLRTLGVESPVKLTYKAMVHQNTGVDWNNVKLVLSTGNPHQNFNLPELNAWYLDDVYYPTQNKKNKGISAESYNNMPSTAANGAGGEGKYLKDDLAKEAFEYTALEENVIQAEFDIKLPYTIPGDNKEHYVSVLSKDLDTKYLYKTVPKLDQSVYLTARIVNWEELNLLPGEAKIFYDGTYIGETAINTGGVEDTLVLSLGQDKNVTVKRTKIKEKNKEKILDNDKFYYSTYEIVVKNGNNKNIEILVEDQLPLSRNKSIVVEKTDLSGAAYDELTGKLSWKQTIKTKDSKKIDFSYTVKAPKDVPVAVR